MSANYPAQQIPPHDISENGVRGTYKTYKTPISSENDEFPDITQLPASMQQAKRWLVWKSVARSAGKPGKVPYYVDGTRRGQGVALDSPQDTARLSNLSDAMLALKSGQYAGLGFALGPDGSGNCWQGVDLDNTTTRPELAQLVDDLPGYTEKSPSGNGWHAVGYGRPFVSLGSNQTGIEAYAGGRFFTVSTDCAGIGEPCCLADFVEQRLRPTHTPAGHMSVASQATMASECATPVQITELRSALLHLRADDRAQWVAMGHALKGLGDVGRGLWLDWSATSDKFDAQDAARCWESFRPTQTGFSAVFKAAQLTGWVNPRSNEAAGAGVAAMTSAGPVWGEPEPITDTLPPVQSFDSALLPESLRGWVADIAERMQCPPDFPAAGAMVALSSVLGRKACVAPKRRDDWRVIPNLWGMIVGRPGVMKSPALSEIMKPLYRLQEEASQQHQQALREAEISSILAECSTKAAKTKAASLAAKGDDEGARRIIEGMLAAEDNGLPPLRRYVVTDATVEALGDILMGNPWGTLAYRDELHGLLCSLDREGQEGSRAFYLQGYDGNAPYTFDRIMRGKNRHIPAVCLAMLGGIQPGKLQAYVHDAVAGGRADDGLLQRFGLLVWPDVAGGWRNVDRFPDTQEKRRAYDVFTRLDGLQPGTDQESGESVPTEYRFTDEAQTEFESWREQLELSLRSGEHHPAVESHLSKYRKLVPALALLCSLADGEQGGIGLPSLLRALGWAEYLETHARRAYAAGQRYGVEAARALVKAIQSGALSDGFTARLVAQKGWAGLGTPDAVRDAAGLLCDLGHLHAVESGPGERGGRPSMRYLIHPAHHPKA